MTARSAEEGSGKGGEGVEVLVNEPYTNGDQKGQFTKKAIHIGQYVYIYLCVCMYVCMYVYIYLVYVCMYVCMYVYIYLVCMCMYVCMYERII